MENTESAIPITVQGLGTPVPAPGSEQAGFLTSSFIDRSATVVVNLATASIDMTRKKKLEAYERLGSKLEELAEFMDRKTNVHKEIKRLVAICRSTYRVMGAPETVHGQAVSPPATAQTTQTTPSLETRSGKRRRDSSTPQDIKPAGKKTRRRVQTAVLGTPPSSSTRPAPKPEKNPAWKTVEKKKRAPRPRPPRPDALLIKAGEGKSYADILRQLRTDDTVKDIAADVDKIRRTAGGDLLLVLSRTAAKPTNKLRDSMKGFLGDRAEVRAWTQETQLEIRDLDEVADKEEVTRALAAQLNANSIEISAVKSLRKAYGGRQTAVVSLPTVTARAALELGKVRIGWTVCRIRDRDNSHLPLRCYRCHDFGHRGQSCRGTDRSQQCLRCGEDGHVAKMCQKEPTCILCKKKGAEKVDHVTGSSRCPVYLSALGKCKQKKRQ